MAKIDLLHSRYTRMISDLSGSELPPGAMIKIQDAIPELYIGGSAVGIRRRGAWLNQSTGGTLNKDILAVKWGLSSGGTEKLFGVDKNGAAWDLTSSPASGLTGTGSPSRQIVYFDDLFIMPLDPGGVGSAVVRKWSGSGALANLGGTPPAAYYATVHKSRLVLGNKSGASTTVYFSAVQDPETWDVESFIETTYPVRGLASLGNSILVFSDGKVEVIRGSTPPTTDGGVGDMTLDGLFDQGVIDARTIVVHDNRVTWANREGIWSSDGTAIENVTELGGMVGKWREAVNTWLVTGTPGPIAAGIVAGWYVVSVGNGYTFAVNLSSRAFITLTNVDANSFTGSQRGDGETYWAPKLAVGESGYVAKLSGIFTPQTGITYADGNSTNVLMVIKWPTWEGSIGSRRWKNLYVQMRTSLIDGQASYVKFNSSATGEIANDAGSTLKFSTSGSAEMVAKVPLKTASSAITITATQVGPMYDCYFKQVSAGVIDRESSRGGKLGTT